MREFWMFEAERAERAEKLANGTLELGAAARAVLEATEECLDGERGVLSQCLAKLRRMADEAEATQRRRQADPIRAILESLDGPEEPPSHEPPYPGDGVPDAPDWGWTDPRRIDSRDAGPAGPTDAEWDDMHADREPEIRYGYE